MKRSLKSVLSVLLCLAMVLSVLPMGVLASGADMHVQVKASSTVVRPGDTVDYVITAEGRGITALQFELIIPEGMTYVAGSAAVPSGLKSYLGWAATDWAERSMMWTGYNDLPADFGQDTVILTFSCVAEKAGTYEIELFELLPFDENYEEFAASLTVDKVTAVEQIPTAPTETEPEATFMNVAVQASKTEVKVGDTIDYTVTAHGAGITALQFELIIPEGMTYVAGSAAVPSGLKSYLGWEATDWTEISMMWTGYSVLPSVFDRDTVILTFSCVAEEAGTYEIELFELLPFDENYEEFAVDLTVDAVTAVEQIPTAPTETEPEATFMNVAVQASKTEVKVGDTIDYTVTAHGAGITALQFELIIPEGMTYVAGSAAVPSGLKSYLGWEATDWTERFMMWTGYNDLPAEFGADTVILTFSCVAEKAGTYEIELFELLPFDENYEEFAASLTVDAVTAVEQIPTAPTETEPEATFMNVAVQASKTEVKVGDTIDYTVTAHGAGITALQFELIIPEGMTYVAGSAAVPSGLKSYLGWEATDWTEISMMWTGYSVLPSVFDRDTVILTFSCVAEEAGTYEIELFELLPFDGNYEEFAADLTVHSVSAIIPGSTGLYTTVFCQAPTSWSSGKVYWWGSKTGTNPSWPGANMTKDENGIWTYDVPSDATGLIFHNGIGTQTADLKVPTDGKTMYVFSKCQWVIPGYPVIEVVEYFVAGQAALCGVDWNPSAEVNKMSDEDKDGIYTLTYTGVAAGTYEFKVTDGTWNQAWGQPGSIAYNYKLEVTEADSTVEIRFDSKACLIEVAINGNTPEPEGPFMNIAICPSRTSVMVGDIVDYTVYAYGKNITALQFNLDIPQGMRYVAGSAVVPSGLKSYLGWAATDWTEYSKMWTGYNDLPADFGQDTVILTFSCVAEKAGTYEIGMFDLLPFDENYEEFDAVLTTDPVVVGGGVEHSFTNYVSNNDATCTADGTKTAVCDCGCGMTDTVADEGSATGHNLTRVEATVTCTEAGNAAYYVCNNCGEMFADATAIIPTNEDEVKIDALGHIDEDGDKTCDRCGFVEKEPTTLPEGPFMNVTVKASKTEAAIGDTIDYTVYAFGNDVTALQFILDIPEGMRYVAGSAAVPSGLKSYLGWAATDWTESYMLWTGYNDLPTEFGADTVILTFSCVVKEAGTYEIELYDLLPFDEDFEEFAASLTVDRVVVSGCTDHVFTTYIFNGDATCTADGTKTAYCDDGCGASDTIVAEGTATGHSLRFVEATVTCTESGNVAYYLCDNCGEMFADAAGSIIVEAESVQRDALGHSFADYISNGDATCTADGTKTAKCDRCDETDTVIDQGSILNHSFTKYVANGDADCFNDGTKTATCDHGCGTTNTRSDNGSALGHSFSNYVSNGDATCLNDGTKTAACDHGCGVTYTRSDNGSALGHRFSNYVSNGDATCTADGTKTAVCDHGCGVTYTRSDNGSVLGHSFSNYVSNGDATCTADGTKTAVCDHGCGVTNTRSDNGSVLGHSFSNYVSNGDADCFNDGTKTSKCDRCSANNTIVDNGSALGHSFTSYVSNGDATCWNNGTETAACDHSCGVRNTREDAGSALGHSFTNYVSNGDATCTADGTKTAVCDHGCNLTDTQTDVGSAQHRYVNHFCEFCGQVDPDATILTGTLITQSEGEAQLTISANGETVCTANISDGSYTLYQLLPGEYTLTVSKEGYANRTYTLTLDAGENVLDLQLFIKGDISGDGKLNMGEVARIYSHVKKTVLLTDYQISCADLTGDGKVNTGDVARIYGIVKKK